MVYYQFEDDTFLLENKLRRNRNSKFLNSMKELKNGDQPFYATKFVAENIKTDMDHFPYTRFFRGQYEFENPIVFDREAGYRPSRDSCYIQKCNAGADFIKRKSCWEPACSTVYPCTRNRLTEEGDIGLIEIMQNNQSFNLYR